MERETCMGGRLSVSEVDNGRYSFVGHFNNVVDIGWRWWAKTHPGTHFTTGMAMVAMALSMCDTVRLYGFSDEPSDHYHYYDTAPSGHRHDFTSEHALRLDAGQGRGDHVRVLQPADYMASTVQDAVVVVRRACGKACGRGEEKASVLYFHRRRRAFSSHWKRCLARCGGAPYPFPIQ